MLPPCFDTEEMSSDFNDIASAVDESGSAVIFKKGMPVYQITPYKCSPGDVGDARAKCEKEIVSGVVQQWMDVYAQDPEPIGLNSLLLRLALNGIMLGCYTDELAELENMMKPETTHEEYTEWILTHLHF